MSERQMIRDSELDYDSDLVCTLEGIPFTGIAFEDSVTLGRSEISFVEGVQEGVARDWYPTGVLKGESNYRHGALHGPSKEYDEDGHVVEESLHEYGVCLWKRRLDSSGAVIEFDQLDPEGEAAHLLTQLRAARGS